jgi:hypothetical protein
MYWASGNVRGWLSHAVTDDKRCYVHNSAILKYVKTGPSIGYGLGDLNREPFKGLAILGFRSLTLSCYWSVFLV